MTVAETLVIHPGALGDVLLAVPALRTLRSRYPEASLSLAAQPRIGELLAALGVVDRALPFDSLRLEPLFVDGPLPERTGALGSAARVISWFGARDPTFVRRLSQLAPGAIIAPPAPAGGLAVWEHLVRTVGGQTAERPSLAPVTVPQSLAEDGLRWLGTAGWAGTNRLVMIHPGAGGVAKRWPTERFARLLEDLARSERFSIVIHEGPSDAEAVAAFLARYRAPAMRLVEPPLPRLAGILRHVAVYVGNDSGISHIAAAAGTPSVVLFTTATLAWSPWAPNARPVVLTLPQLEAADVARVVANVRGLLT
jgi:ADP-heptose:LPS heptosyltransferase